ncbi:MAG: hypothetical protein RLY93_12355 [Sumerlaeia bacterium]
MTTQEVLDYNAEASIEMAGHIEEGKGGQYGAHVFTAIADARAKRDAMNRKAHKYGRNWAGRVGRVTFGPLRGRYVVSYQSVIEDLEAVEFVTITR